MHCKNCLHYEVCVKLGKPSLYGINQEIGCSAYKDRTKWGARKRGRWIETKLEVGGTCSECGNYYEWFECEHAHYCPNCGAEMNL